jgi:hypothetical protein
LTLDVGVASAAEDLKGLLKGSLKRSESAQPASMAAVRAAKVNRKARRGPSNEEFHMTQPTNANKKREYVGALK